MFTRLRHLAEYILWALVIVQIIQGLKSMGREIVAQRKLKKLQT